MQSTIKILNIVALAASFLSAVASTPVAQVPEANPNKDRPGAISRVRPRPPLRPDLVVLIVAPRSANAGDEIGRNIKIRARNRGLAAAPGTDGRIDADDGYMIDVVLSTNALLPDGFAQASANLSRTCCSAVVALAERLTSPRVASAPTRSGPRSPLTRLPDGTSSVRESTREIKSRSRTNITTPRATPSISEG